MRRAPNDKEAVGWARGLIERQLGQLVRLIDDLLDVSRVSRGRIELRREEVDLRSVVNGALEICAPLIEQGGHRLALDLPAERIPLLVDPTRLIQVLCNLLSNAAKYTPSGGRIELAARRTTAGVEIAVRDNGVGIPEDMLGRVFDMFTQVERSLERAQGGLGIGLTLVKRLVELHGGTVEARSAGPGRGSEFVIRLPDHAAAASAPASLATLEEPLPDMPPGRRILVADDNRDAADSLAFMLRVVGHDVRTAYDGEQAVQIADAFRPALALIDIGMPRMNGYDAARSIRARDYGREMVLVALTGWGQPEDKQRSQLAGFDHHLVKPVDPSVLDRLLAGR
jgi:CheY-like chemotaxis protein/two-component sensor histidine kinase